MPHITHFRPYILCDPPPDRDTRVTATHHPKDLISSGFNIPVKVSQPITFAEQARLVLKKSVIVKGLLDTGASTTALSASVAAHLELESIRDETVRVRSPSNLLT